MKKMGRRLCCNKIGVKKGPWTPEEDIFLVSYVQQHGPGNWRAVPSSTGLMRCSKSCRLRWTNYLRPGINRGSFTGHEEKMIIQLQALLGNKWAAIASYLPERTDNHIKNYWNTHLKKKLKRIRNGSGDPLSGKVIGSAEQTDHAQSVSRGLWERRLQADIHTAKQALKNAVSIDGRPESINPEAKHGQQFTYASSTENIARLLKGWVKNSPGSEEYESNNDATTTFDAPEGKIGIDLSEALESLFGCENFESSNSDGFSRSGSPGLAHQEAKPDPDGLDPLSVIENWLLNDQGKEYKEYLTNFTFDEDPNLF